MHLLLSRQIISYWINIPIILTTAWKGHHICLLREEGWSGLLVKLEQTLKGVPQTKLFKFLAIIIKKIPVNFKCNYNKAAVKFYLSFATWGLSTPFNFLNLAQKLLFIFSYYKSSMEFFNAFNVFQCIFNAFLLKLCILKL